MIVRGHIKDNQILIDENIQLPDGNPSRNSSPVDDEAVRHRDPGCAVFGRILEKPKKLSRK